MHIDELAAEYRLAPEIPDILEVVRQVSGKGVDFRPAEKLDVTASTKMARERMPQHVIIFDQRKTDRLSYVIAHECGHIIRTFQLPADERFVPVTTRASLAAAAEVLVDEAASFLSPTLVPKMVNFWVRGLVLQVTNQPVDVRIERWIASDYPGLEQEQVEGLEKDARFALQGLKAEVERTTPPTAFRASNAMNYAYLSHIGEITGRDYQSRFRGREEIVELGQRLYEISTEEWSDVEVADRWAQALGIEEWFSWRAFEDMPESYYQL